VRKGEKKVPPKEATVTLKVKVFPKHTLMLRQAVVTAERGGKKWECCLNMYGGMVPMIRLPDERFVLFEWESLVEAASSVPN
jgi:hypothetical protein